MLKDLIVPMSGTTKVSSSARSTTTGEKKVPLTKKILQSYRSKQKKENLRSYLVSPATIAHPKNKEVKIKMLLRKPFAFTDGDNCIGKRNDKISEMAYAEAGHYTLHPTAMLPKESLFQPFNQKKQEVNRDNNAKSSSVGFTMSNPPLIHKRCRKMESLD